MFTLCSLSTGLGLSLNDNKVIAESSCTFNQLIIALVNMP